MKIKTYKSRESVKTLPRKTTSVIFDEEGFTTNFSHLSLGVGMKLRKCKYGIGSITYPEKKKYPDTLPLQKSSGLNSGSLNSASLKLQCKGKESFAAETSREITGSSKTVYEEFLKSCVNSTDSPEIAKTFELVSGYVQDEIDLLIKSGASNRPADALAFSNDRTIKGFLGYIRNVLPKKLKKAMHIIHIFCIKTKEYEHLPKDSSRVLKLVKSLMKHRELVGEVILKDEGNIDALVSFLLNEFNMEAIAINRKSFELYKFGHREIYVAEKTRVADFNKTLRGLEELSLDCDHCENPLVGDSDGDLSLIECYETLHSDEIQSFELVPLMKLILNMIFRELSSRVIAADE